MTNTELLRHAEDAQLNLISKNCEEDIVTCLPIESVRIFENGHFTVALINSRFVGVSKFNPKDYSYTKPKKSSGEYRAIARAIRQKLGMEGLLRKK